MRARAVVLERADGFSPSSGASTGPARQEGREGAEPVRDLLLGGAVLAAGRGGEILEHRSPLPPPFTLLGPRPARRLHEVGPPALGRCLLRLFEEVRGDGQARTAEVTLASAEGDSAEPSTVSLRIAPHPARDRIFLVTARNVTAHGERLQHLCRALDALRAERDEWESAARSVAHDVRSSLAALTGFLSLSLLEPSALGPGAREHVSRALEIGTRLTTLTELLIDNPRRRPAEAEFLDLGAFGTRLLIALQVAHSQVGFAWSVEASGVGLRTSPSALWNLLWGLVTNSVKYRHPGRQLHIDLRARMHGGEVEIELQDNGIGIPPGEEEAVFAPGCRGSNAGAQEGSGLGLHGVRLLTQKCRGRVLAEPSPAGATFRVFLPASGPAG